MSGHALWQDGGRTRHPLTQQHHLHVRCRLFEEMFYCHEVIIIPLRFTATFFFFFFPSFLPSKTWVLQGLLNCGAQNVCLRESDLVRSLGEGKKKKKALSNSRAGQLSLLSHNPAPCLNTSLRSILSVWSQSQFFICFPSRLSGIRQTDLL